MNTTLTDWKLEDYVKTTEDRAMFLEASLEEAVEENDPGIFSDALAAIAKMMSGKSERGFAAVMRTVSAGIDRAQTMARDDCGSRRATHTVKRIRRERVKA